MATKKSVIMEEQLVLLKKAPKKNADKITELEDKIKKSKRAKGSRVKGAVYENTIAKIFKEHPRWGLSLTRTPSSGGFKKKEIDNPLFRGDLSCVDEDLVFLLHIETKNVKMLKVKEWIKQAESDCSEGYTPVVIMHINQEIKNRKIVTQAGDYVIIKLEHFLDLVDVSKVIKKVSKKRR